MYRGMFQLEPNFNLDLVLPMSSELFSRSAPYSRDIGDIKNHSKYGALASRILYLAARSTLPVSVRS